MSRTTNLAAALLNAAASADPVSEQAAADLRQAAAELADIDALDELASDTADAQAIVSLTNTINRKAGEIHVAENGVELITGAASTILTAVGAFGTGNVANGINGVVQASKMLGQL